MGITISKFNREFRLESELVLPRSLEEVFPFFARAENLEQLTPTFLKFQIASPIPIEMKEGATIDYDIRVRGLPIRWTSLISLWDPPHRFVDEQLRGPYRYWIHLHSFEEKGGQTIVRDFVRYQVIGGSLIHEFFVKKDLMKIFSFREEQLLDRFS